MQECSAESAPKLEDLLKRDLLQRYGPMVGDDDLRVALGYKSMDAFRQALARKTIQVPVFSLPGRRGKFALVQDIATLLSARRDEALREMRSGESGSYPFSTTSGD